MTVIARSKTSGITLLEILLSLAVMAMIGVGIGSLFNTGGQIWRSIDSSQHLADHAIARQSLRSALENMPVVSHATSLDDIFLPHDSGFSFRPSLSDSGNQVDWVEIELSNHQFRIGSAIAYSNLSRFQISYFGKKDVLDELEWFDDWIDATLLPRLIKIESWKHDGIANPPLSVQPAKITRQDSVSLSSLVPPS